MNNRKEHYNKKGMYAGYDKNHKERDALDYYSTPIDEVTNILTVLGIDFSQETILEPCAGGGHMLQGIANYISKAGCKGVNIYASDIQERETIFHDYVFATGKDYDFLSDEYPFVDNNRLRLEFDRIPKCRYRRFCRECVSHQSRFPCWLPGISHPTNLTKLRRYYLEELPRLLQPL